MTARSLGGDLGGRRTREDGVDGERRMLEWIGDAVRAVAAGFGHGFAEVAEQVLVEASRRFRVGEDLLEAVEVLLFAAEEELLEAFGEGVEVVGFLEEAVSLADAAGLEDEVAVGFEVGEGLDDALAVGVESGGGLVDVDGGPEAGFVAGGEEVAEELSAAFIVAEEDLVGGAEELELVGGVERGGGGDEAVELEVGEQRVDDEGADVVGAGEFAEREVEGVAGLEDLVEDAADRVGRRGVAVDEVLQHAAGRRRRRAARRRRARRRGRRGRSPGCSSRGSSGRL